jgi:hypothetical protein
MHKKKEEGTMGIQEKINYFTKNMNSRFAEINLIKMIQTIKDMKRYVTKEMKGERNLQFTSQDLRSFAIALTNELKKLQRNIEFDRFNKQLQKNKILTTELWVDECKKFQKKLNLAMDLQPLVLEVNYYAVVVDILEQMIEKEKQEGDEIFNHEILAGLLEIF